MIAYIEDIQRRAKEQVAIEAAHRELRMKPLHRKIKDWWELRPPTQGYVTMEQLVCEFETAPGLIGNALHQLGWQRKRIWGKAGYRRYWVAPT